MGRVHLAALKASEEISLAGIVEPVDGVRANLEGENVPLFAVNVRSGAATGVLSVTG